MFKKCESIIAYFPDLFQIARNSLLEETLHNFANLDKVTGKLFNNQRYSDIVLVVGSRKFYAHRMILSAWSDVFKTMLCDPTWQPNNDVPEPETKGSHQHIQQDLIEEEQCAEVFEGFLKFLYCSSVSLTTENVLPLCRLADKYLVTDLRELCLKYIRDKQDDLDAALYLFQSASDLKMPRVVESCLEILQTKFNLLTGQQLQRLDSKSLVALLDSGLRVLVDDEFTVFKKVEPWLHQRQDNDAFIRVINLIRFPYMNATQLKKTTESSVILRAFELIPDLELKFWQLQSLYKEGNVDKLPEEFPCPRMYFYGYKHALPKTQQNQGRSSRTKMAGCTEVQISDHRGRRLESCRAWFGREVDGKQVFELKDSSFTFKVTKSTQNKHEADIEMSSITTLKRKQHIAMEVDVAKRPCQYFRAILQENTENSGSEDKSFCCTASSGIQPFPDKFRLRVSAIIEPEETKKPDKDEINADSG